MGFSQRLELRQSQTLVMTPQLQQAIKMLQLSNLELTDFVDAEIQQNPLLERREGNAEEPFAAAEPSAPDGGSPTVLPDTSLGEFMPDAAEHWHAAAGADGDGSVDLGGEPQSWRARNGALGSDDRPGFRDSHHHRDLHPGRHQVGLCHRRHHHTGDHHFGLGEARLGELGWA